MDLSQRQADAIDFIGWFVQTHGYSPSMREIGEEVGYSSPSSTYRMLEQLRDLGLVTWNPRSFRTLRLLSGATAS